MFEYIKRLGIAISVLLNVILFGESNQTFSARNYGWKREGKPNLVLIIDLIFWFEKNHSMQAWVYWYTRKYGGIVTDGNNLRERELSLVYKGEEFS